MKPAIHAVRDTAMTEESSRSDFQELLERTKRIEERQAAPPVQPMELRSFDELERWAERAARSNMVPKDYKGNPDNIILAVQMGAELGLRPMQALQNIAVIGGRPCVWGDAMLALCMTHPLYNGCKEWMTGDGDTLTAHCVTIRRGDEPKVATFSVADAKTAKLWMKKGYNGQDTPWITNPKRMLQMRARGFALRDAFPDKLRGLISAEEAADYQPEPAFSAAPPPIVQHAPAATDPPKRETIAEFLDALERDLTAAQTAEAVDEIVARPRVQAALDSLKNGAKARLDAMVKAALDRTAPAADGDGWPGPDVAIPDEERVGA